MIAWVIVTIVLMLGSSAVTYHLMHIQKQEHGTSDELSIALEFYNIRNGKLGADEKYNRKQNLNKRVDKFGKNFYSLEQGNNGNNVVLFLRPVKSNKKKDAV